MSFVLFHFDLQTFLMTYFWKRIAFDISIIGLDIFSQPSCFLNILKITWFDGPIIMKKSWKLEGAKMIVVPGSFFRFVPSLQSVREKCHNYYLPHPLISKWFLKILPLVLLSAFHSFMIKSIWNVMEFGQKTRATGGAVICIHFWFWQLLS